MPLSSYLPSAQFTLVVSSIALAGGLVLVADYFTSPSDNSAVVTSETPSGITPMDWESSLAAIQGDKSFPKPLDPTTLASLQAETASPTMTGTVGRSLLLNLAEAKSQGLGSDFPTQERLIAGAVAQTEVERGSPVYTLTDLKTVPETIDSLRAYGNALASTLQNYPKTSREETILAVSQAAEKGTKEGFAPLAAIEGEYRALTSAIVALPVPLTLSPLHLQIANNLARITSLYTDFRATLTDPVRGIGALKLYQSLVLETQRILTNIASLLTEGGIIFESNEPGAVWNLLLTTQDDL